MKRAYGYGISIKRLGSDIRVWRFENEQEYSDWAKDCRDFHYSRLCFASATEVRRAKSRIARGLASGWPVDL